MERPISGIQTALTTNKKIFTEDLFKITSNLDELKKEQEEIKKEQKETGKDKIKHIEILGIFMGFFTFISVEIQILRSINSFFEIAGLSMIMFSGTIGFILTLFLVAEKWIRPENDSFKSKKFFIWLGVIISVLLLGIGLIFYGDHRKTIDAKCNFDYIKVEEKNKNLNSDLQLYKTLKWHTPKLITRKNNDDFFSNILPNWLAAIGTISAVIVSLFLSMKGEKIKFFAKAEYCKLLVGSMKEIFFNVLIANNCQKIIKIKSIQWKVRKKFATKIYTQIPDNNQFTETLPKTLEEGDELNLFFKKEIFEKNIDKSDSKNISLYFKTSTNKKYKIKISKDSLKKIGLLIDKKTDIS